MTFFWSFLWLAGRHLFVLFNFKFKHRNYSRSIKFYGGLHYNCSETWTWYPKWYSFWNCPLWSVDDKFCFSTTLIFNYFRTFQPFALSIRHRLKLNLLSVHVYRQIFIPLLFALICCPCISRHRSNKFVNITLCHQHKGHPKLAYTHHHHGFKCYNISCNEHICNITGTGWHAKRTCIWIIKR